MRTSLHRVDVAGVPFNSAGTTDGVARAPQALRRAGIIEAVTGARFTVSDHGDVDLPPPTRQRDAESHVTVEMSFTPDRFVPITSQRNVAEMLDNATTLVDSCVSK